MAPKPKPPGQRRRRNKGQAEWKTLPAAGREGKAPTLPGKGWRQSTKDWWQLIWKSPMATVWLDSDVDGLVRLAYLKDAVARKINQPSLHAQITALEDRYGLSPKARRGLQWEIAAKEDDTGSAAGSSKPRAVRAKTS